MSKLKHNVKELNIQSGIYKLAKLFTSLRRRKR